MGRDDAGPPARVREGVQGDDGEDGTTATVGRGRQVAAARRVSPPLGRREMGLAGKEADEGRGLAGEEGARRRWLHRRSLRGARRRRWGQRGGRVGGEWARVSTVWPQF